MAESAEAMEVSEMDDLGQKEDTVIVLDDIQSSPAVQSAESTSPVPAGVDNTERITVYVKTPQDRKLVSVSASADIKELKEATSKEFAVADERLCFIYSGKVLTDDDVLASHGIGNGGTVHLVIKTQVDPQQSTSTDETAEEKPVYGPMQFAQVGMDHLNYAQLQQHMQRQMSNNPELIRQMVQNPLVQQLMSNPSVITKLISSNPQTKDWLKRNPELAEMLNDKEVMQQTLEIANNPDMLNEMIAAQGKVKSSNAGAGSNKYGASNLPELQTMWHHLAQKPQLLQQMFNAPYTKSFLEGMSANPLVTQQMIANQQLFAKNPVLQQQMQHMMPQYLQQLQNPAMQSMMTNTKAMQAMIKVQRGLEMLHAEAPGLVGSFGMPFLSQPPSLSTFVPPASATVSADADATSSADAMSNALSQVISQIASGNITQPPEERFKDQLDQLSTMGFTDQQTNIQVLVGTFGDLKAAVEHLNRQQPVISGD